MTDKYFTLNTGAKIPAVGLGEYLGWDAWTASETKRPPAPC